MDEARAAAESDRLVAEKARSVAEEAWETEKKARLLAEQRNAALQAELRALRSGAG